MTEKRDELIDMRAHFVTDTYVAAAKIAGHTRPDGVPDWPSWAPEEHLRLMDEHVIRTSVFSISSPDTRFPADPAPAQRAVLGRLGVR